MQNGSLVNPPQHWMLVQPCWSPFVILTAFIGQLFDFDDILTLNQFLASQSRMGSTSKAVVAKVRKDIFIYWLSDKPAPRNPCDPKLFKLFTPLLLAENTFSILKAYFLQFYTFCHGAETKCCILKLISCNSTFDHVLCVFI